MNIDKSIDKSLTGIRYLLTIAAGRNRQVTSVIKHDGDSEIPIEGDFVLTIGKSAVILTRNREPIFVKRWTPRDLKSYVDVFKAIELRASKTFIAEVFQDSDGWIWEGGVDKEGNYFIIMNDDEYLYTISFD
jgi:hypothetical protein